MLQDMRSIEKVGCDRQKKTEMFFSWKAFLVQQHATPFSSIHFIKRNYCQEENTAARLGIYLLVSHVKEGAKDFLPYNKRH
jgi:hypothetical protein